MAEKKPVRKKAPAKKPAITIRPREPLTKKAKRAIEQYVFHRARAQDGNIFAIQGIHWTLDAERMSRIQLYAWLEERGYRWKSGRWEQRRTAQGAAQNVKEASE